MHASSTISSIIRLFAFLFLASSTRTLAADNSVVGRPVRIVAISFNVQEEHAFEEIHAVVDNEGEKGADLIVLPELMRGQDDQSIEKLTGSTITSMQALAERHDTYIICPIDRQDGNSRLNSAVLIDRNGKIQGIYDKTFPYWSEFDHALPVTVAEDVPVFQTDFGKLGIAICFDVNFPELWQELADQGAELVIWPSAYSAGTSLQSHAINHHYYIASATWKGDCQVYDITGQRILDEQSNGIHVSRITLDLDRGIYHENFNMTGREKLLSERSADVEEELFMKREQWFVLRAKRPGISARALAKEYGMEELRDYIERSRTELQSRRGGALVTKAPNN